MIKIKHIYQGLIFFVLTATSCSEYIDLEPGEFVKNIIIDATLTNEFKTYEVVLSQTKTINDPSFPVIKNASVFLTFNDTVINYFENDSLPGHYYSEIAFAGVPGTTYKLTVTNIDVNNDGISDEYVGTATMGSLVLIDSAGYYYKSERKATVLTCFSYDPPEKNYYFFKAYINDTLVSDTLNKYNFTDDVAFNGNKILNAPCYYFQDENEMEFIEKGDSLTLELNNIDEAFFTYLNSSFYEYYGYNPMFGGMPANIESNFSNNALGIFRVYTVSRSSVVVSEDFDRN
ncbi:MAG: DUF4249 family protein [Salinivirgaceae bacterium]|nr:DUF4249 family protein [Salinivirgaceae bacterium]